MQVADFLLKQINSDVLDELSAICARFEHVNEKVMEKPQNSQQARARAAWHCVAASVFYNRRKAFATSVCDEALRRSVALCCS